MPESDFNTRKAEEMRRRRKAFAVRVVHFVESPPRSTAGQAVGRQLLRSATSVAANDRAACRARSRAEFIAKMSIVVEEAGETEFWLELLIEAGLVEEPRLCDLLAEPRELVKIGSASRRTARANSR